MRNSFKLICLISLLAAQRPVYVSAQTIVEKYYDSTWFNTSKESAFYISQYKKAEHIYLCNTYRAKSNTLFSICARLDTFSYARKIGLSLNLFENGQVSDSTMYDSEGQLIYSYHFYENGQLKDSIFYKEKGETDHAYHYYENGSLKVHYYHDKTGGKEIAEAYDEKGNTLDHFVYEVKAEFPGGEPGWRRFVEKNLNPVIPVDHKAPNGMYKVMVSFIVEKDGTLSDIKAETNHGYGMEKEVIRMLKKSPKWTPGIYLNESIISHRHQPVTFFVEGL